MLKFAPRYFILPLIALVVIGSLPAPADGGARDPGCGPALTGAADPTLRAAFEQFRRNQSRGCRQDLRPSSQRHGARRALIARTRLRLMIFPRCRKPRKTTMRFMMIYRPANTKDMEAGAPPSPQLIAEMGKFIEEMAKSGVLLFTDGLLPSSRGARVRQSGPRSPSLTARSPRARS
jgi:hypothetical protein